MTYMNCYPTNDEPQPRNHGLTWEKEDLQLLKDLFEKGASVLYLAARLGRTTVSINCKLEWLGIDPTAPRAVTQTPTQEKQMSFTISVANKTFINGADAATMSEEDFFNLIYKAEQEIERLDKIEHKPKVLHLKKDELVKGIMQVVGLLDAR